MALLRALAVAATVLVVAAAGLVAMGLAFGNPWLLLPRLPPRSGMDRFLLIVWPAACLLEAVLAGLRPRTSAMALAVGGAVLRLAMAGVLGWVLLWGSVHLRGETAWLPLTLWSIGAAFVWQVLPRHTSQHVVTAAVALALVAAGVLIVVGGWLKGGLVALPLAMAIGALGWRARDEQLRSVVIGCGTAALVALVALGHFFGRVSVLQAGLMAASLVAVAAVASSTWARGDGGS
jgi:hypothetical protein